MKNKSLIIFIILVVCTACAPVTFTKEEFDKQLENTITIQETAWQKLSITSYQIEVKHGSIWGNFSLVVTVKNNKVEIFDGKCGENMSGFDHAACSKITSELPSDIYIIDKMFENLKRSHANFETDLSQYSRSNWHESISITFNTQYHYPKLIRYDVPDINDEEYLIEIIDFRVLEK